VRCDEVELEVLPTREAFHAVGCLHNSSKPLEPSLMDVSLTTLIQEIALLRPEQKAGIEFDASRCCLPFVV